MTGLQPLLKWPVRIQGSIGSIKIFWLHEKGWVLWFQRVKDRFVLPTFRSECSECSDRNVGKTNLSFTRWNQRTQPFSWLCQWRSPRLILTSHMRELWWRKEVGMFFPAAIYVTVHNHNYLKYIIMHSHILVTQGHNMSTFITLHTVCPFVLQLIAINSAYNLCYLTIIISSDASCTQIYI